MDERATRLIEDGTVDVKEVECRFEGMPLNQETIDGILNRHQHGRLNRQSSRSSSEGNLLFPNVCAQCFNDKEHLDLRRRQEERAVYPSIDHGSGERESTREGREIAVEPAPPLQLGGDTKNSGNKLKAKPTD